jgi:hypothetical protein
MEGYQHKFGWHAPYGILEEDWEAEEEDWCRCSEGKDSNACTASVLTFMIEDG